MACVWLCDWLRPALEHPKSWFAGVAKGDGQCLSPVMRPVRRCMTLGQRRPCVLCFALLDILAARFILAARTDGGDGRLPQGTAAIRSLFGSCRMWWCVDYSLCLYSFPQGSVACRALGLWCCSLPGGHTQRSTLQMRGVLGGSRRGAKKHGCATCRA